VISSDLAFLVPVEDAPIRTPTVRALFTFNHEGEHHDLAGNPAALVVGRRALASTQRPSPASAGAGAVAAPSLRRWKTVGIASGRTGGGMRARRYLNAVSSGTRRLVPRRRPRPIEAALLAAAILLAVIVINALS
jgi:hypothetical protein